MSRQSHFSLHNSLPSEDDAWERFDLNPALVDDGSSHAFALSTLCIGPRLGTGADKLTLRLVCDGAVTEIAAIEQRSEDLEDAAVLTIALFDASRRLLEVLMRATSVEVRLSGSAARVTRRLERPNRLNLQSFVDTFESGSSHLQPLPMATAAG